MKHHSCSFIRIISLRQIDEGKTKRRDRMNNLNWLAINIVKGGPQEFMSFNEKSQALLENFEIKRANNARSGRDRAFRAVTESPQAFLKNRKRHRSCARNTDNGRQTSHRCGRALIDKCGECRNRRVVRNRPQAQFNAKCRFNLHCQNCGLQRVAAQIEEISVAANPG